VKLVKKGVSASIPQKRSFHIGGTPFTLESASEVEAALQSPAVKKMEADEKLKDQCRALIREQGPLNTSQVRAQIPAGSDRIGRALAGLAASPVEQIAAEPKGSATIYSWVEGELDSPPSSSQAG
jgi:hypothetical protein